MIETPSEIVDLSDKDSAVNSELVMPKSETHANDMRKRIVTILSWGLFMVIALIAGLYLNGQSAEASDVSKILFTPIFTAASIILTFYFAERK